MTILIPSYKFNPTDKMRVDNVAVSTVANDKTTVEFLMKWDGTDNAMPFGFSTYYDLWLVNGFFGFNTGQGDVYGIQSTNLLNKWVHVTAVFNNGDIAQNKIYINGVLQTLTHLHGSPSVNKNVSSTFFLSGWSTTSTYDFGGELSNLRIWKGERTQTEITTTTFDLAQTSDPNLLGFWRLDKNMEDSSNFLNHGTGLVDTGYTSAFITDPYLESILPQGNWITNDGNWTVDSNKQFVMSANSSTHAYLVKNEIFQSFSLESTFYMTTDNDGIGFTFDFKNSNDYKQVVYSGGGINGTNVITVFHVINGVRNQIHVDNSVPHWSLNTNTTLKLSVAYNVVSFYVQGSKIFDLELPVEHDGLVGFYAYSQQYSIKTMKLRENLVNKMTGIFIRYAVDSADVLAEIEARQIENSDVNTEITPKVVGISSFDTEIDIVYAGYSDVLIEIQPYGHTNLPAEIEVRPHNRMWALYEVEQPPIVTTLYNPVKDAFTREMAGYESINYGSTNSMVVGTSGADISRSYVQFDFGVFNPSYVITDVKFRLYYKSVAPKHIKFEIYTANDKWLENSITHLNRPTPDKFVANTFTVDEVAGYVEFDVKDVVKEWIEGKRINNGFIIRVENEVVSGQAIFNTRESSNPPELVISHYDSRIFSTGRSQVPTEINIVISDKHEINTEITVDSVFSDNERNVEIYVHVDSVPLDSDIPVEIQTTKAKVATQITVARYGEIQELAEISVWGKLEDKRDAEIAISRPIVNTEIFSAYSNNVDTEITPKVFRDSKVDTEISVNKYFVTAEIFTRAIGESSIPIEISINKDLVEVEILVVSVGESYIDTEIEINSIFHSKVNTELTVNKAKVATEITSRVKNKKDIWSEISVTRKTVYSEIYVKYRDEVDTEITIENASKRHAELSVSRPSVHTEIYARAVDKSEILSEIHVYYHNDIDTEIEARSVSQVEVEIEARSVSQLNVEITVNRKQIHTELMIPYYADYDLPTEIYPRILNVDNLNISITVGQRGGAYVFIL